MSFLKSKKIVVAAVALFGTLVAIQISTIGEKRYFDFWPTPSREKVGRPVPVKLDLGKADEIEQLTNPKNWAVDDVGPQFTLIQKNMLTDPKPDAVQGR